MKVNDIPAAGGLGSVVRGQGLTLHQSVEGIDGRQVSGDGNVLVPPRRLNVHGDGA